ncbi:hypothetical protein ABIC65_001042 [Sphingomonas trueperi]
MTPTALRMIADNQSEIAEWDAYRQRSGWWRRLGFIWEYFL